MKSVIINADDFGRSGAVNHGIIKGHADGILTSTTLLVNGPASDEAADLAKAHPQLGVGVHLNILQGQPVSEASTVPSLVNKQGTFPGNAGTVLIRLVFGLIRREDLDREIHAQITRFKEIIGSPTHIDSEKHLYAFGSFAAAAIQAAADFGIPAMRCPVERARSEHSTISQRLKSALLNLAARNMRTRAVQSGLRVPDAFIGVRDTGQMTAARYADIFRNIDDGLTEIMCHPGLPTTEEEPAFTSGFLSGKREIELEGLLAAELPAIARDNDIQLIHFGQLKES